MGIRAIDQIHSSIPLGVDVARSQVKDAKFINKFGYNSAVGSVTWETVWDGNNDYTYIETAGTAQATSSNSAADDGGTILVSGLDSNYKEITETLTIGGAAGTKQFYRVHRAQLVTANTGRENVGSITVTVDTKSAAIISPNLGQTLMSVYTVPRGYKGYVLQIDTGCAKDLEHQIRLAVKVNGGVWNTKSYFTQRGGFNALQFVIPIEIEPESDMEIKAISSATGSVSAGYELMLVEDR